MSRENVDTVRRAIDAFMSADYDVREPGFDDFAAIFDLGVEFDVSRTNPESEVFFGRDGMIEILERWVQTWDAYEIEAVELIDAGTDRVVTEIRERGKLKGSDAWVEHTRGAVWTIRDQRVVQYEEHQDRARALEAAGLRE